MYEFCDFKGGWNRSLTAVQDVTHPDDKCHQGDQCQCHQDILCEVAPEHYRKLKRSTCLQRI